MKRVLIALLAAGFCVSIVLGEKIVEVASAPAGEISEKTKDLAELKKSLKEKRVEKEKYLLEEKTIRRELGRIEKDLSKLQQRGDDLRRQIRKAEKNLVQSEKELKLAGWERQQWNCAMDRELDRWYRAHHSHPVLFVDPVAEKMRVQALTLKRSCLGNAQHKELLSQQAIKKFQADQQRLLDLKKQQEQNLAEHAKIKGQKQDILKTTIGRRVVAEEDIKKLMESAKALQQLIVRLEREKLERERQEREREKKKGQAARPAEPRKIEVKKNHLPWPVHGEVVVKFGKSKHPEMDTYVISNGIKIKTAAGASVQSVGRGEVMFSGEFRSYGQMVIIDHGGNFYTIYGNLNDIAVEEGQKVEEGAVIGKVASGAPAVLYFEVRVESQPEDPLQWLK